MGSYPARFTSPRTVSLLGSCLILLVAGSCIVDSNPTVPVGGIVANEGGIAIRPAIDLEPFRELARNADCADTRNRLFLIDQRLVFWTRESSCSDAAFGHTLYRRTISNVICDLHDSIAGPMGDCHGSGSDTALFDTMLKNLDEPDLGLGAAHSVEPVMF
jgi:hypothetical protein